MDIRREWQRDPPVWSIEGGGGVFTLRDLVTDFNRRRADPSSPIHRNRDDIVDWCAEAPDLPTAIKRAVRSKRRNGKKHNHQSRVYTLGALEKRALSMTAQAQMARAGTFERMIEIISGFEVYGIGPVTEYDVATRIAAFLRLEPDAVHMHAGCLAGARALLGSWVKMGQTLPVSEFPVLTQAGLNADQIEDFLCVYRGVLADVYS